ncbi:hypothetical protein [Sphingobium sp. B11D3D]|uniref:hypothetical protein n=1 Tax=Sphingobium sp. B11D3D TaxID=2940576 RepID=UPI00222590F6|nr:hypothetical protein [Sphingobium sp. B11D3D]MCW2370180.1 hypothetical protein [Sphingobium sp. B11D3D]
MFKSKTVFVIGAGASAEAELPIGKHLTKRIAQLVDFRVGRLQTLTQGDPQLLSILEHMVRQDPDPWPDNQFLRSGREVAEAMQLAPSIDTFLQTHKDNREYVLLGKLGIAKAILAAEARSRLAPTADQSSPFDMRSVADTWYVSLAQHLFSGVPADDPLSAFENVSFIVFNYDRCLEVFLHRAIAVYFPRMVREVDAIMSKVRIVHPYGDLGALTLGAEGRTPFGSESADLLRIANRILTFSETIEDNQLLHRIKTIVNEAETLVFLGFAFHEQNMEILNDNVPKGEKRNSIKRVYATTLGVSQSDQQIIRSQIGDLVKGRPIKDRDQYSIQIADGECKKMFEEYWRSLSAVAADQARFGRYNLVEVIE